MTSKPIVWSAVTGAPYGRLFCFREVIVVSAMATLNKPFQLAPLGMNLWRNRLLREAFVEAQVALGESMYRAGIDDGELGAKISAIDDQLHRAEALEGSTHALTAVRRQLLLQLAAAALEDDGPLPGADAEYSRARKAQKKLKRHEKDVNIRGTSSWERRDAQSGC